MFAVGEAKVKKGVEAPRFDGSEKPRALASNSCKIACRGTVVYVNENNGITSEVIHRNGRYRGTDLEVFLLDIK